MCKLEEEKSVFHETFSFALTVTNSLMIVHLSWIMCALHDKAGIYKLHIYKGSKKRRDGCFMKQQ